MPAGLKKTIKITLETGLLLGLLFIFLAPAHAQSSIGGDWDQFLGGLKNFQGVSATSGTTGEDLVEILIRNGIRIFRNLIGVVAILLAVLYASSFVLSRGNEETIQNQKNNFTYMLLGFVVILSAEQIASIFNPVQAQADKIIDFSALSDRFREIASYLKWFLGTIMVVFMSISGLRMIVARGDEEVITTQKNHLLWSFIGGLVVLLADSMIKAVYSINSSGVVVGAANPNTKGGAIDAIAGVIRLGLAFVGPMAIIFTIYAGYLYLTSFQDEEQTAKAKKMIIGGLTGIVVIYAAFAIVNTFFLNTPSA